MTQSLEKDVLIPALAQTFGAKMGNIRKGKYLHLSDLFWKSQFFAFHTFRIFDYLTISSVHQQRPFITKIRWK